MASRVYTSWIVKHYYSGFFSHGVVFGCQVSWLLAGWLLGCWLIRSLVVGWLVHWLLVGCLVGYWLGATFWRITPSCLYYCDCGGNSVFVQNPNKGKGQWGVNKSSFVRMHAIVYTYRWKSLRRSSCYRCQTMSNGHKRSIGSLTLRR